MPGLEKIEEFLLRPRNVLLSPNVLHSSLSEINVLLCEPEVGLRVPGCTGQEDEAEDGDGDSDDGVDDEPARRLRVSLNCLERKMRKSRLRRWRRLLAGVLEEGDGGKGEGGG